MGENKTTPKVIIVTVSHLSFEILIKDRCV